MSWEIVTRADRARQLQRSYADYWRRTPHWEVGWPHLGLPPAKETAEKLAELAPDAVDAIMGRRETYTVCDGCGEEAATTAYFDINGGEFALDICAKCCDRMKKEIEGEPG